MTKKFTITKKELQEVMIDEWVNLDGTVFTKSLDFPFLPEDYNWETDTELLSWAKEILEDEQKLLAHCFPPEDGYEVTIV